MARALCLNEDLTEAIALVHDLGHTPFGHSGEDVLNELLSDSGGFNHNRQSLRVVDFLEDRYPDFPGLNLTWEVREGIVKHETKQKVVHPEFNSAERPTLEASLVDQADEITYNAHDIDDGLRSGLLNVAQVASLSIWGVEQQELLHNNTDCNREKLHQIRSSLVRWLLDLTARDVLTETDRRLKENNIDSKEKLRNSSVKLCGYSETLDDQVIELKKFLGTNLYSHPVLEEHSRNAAEIIKKLFDHLVTNQDVLPDRFKRRLDTEAISIVVTDYIAGMTDRYAEQIYQSIKK
jgi:dGTPase